MIKVVLFDLDGTLLDRDRSVKDFIGYQYERLNKRVGHIPKNVYMSRFIELDRRGYVWKDKVYQQLVTEFQITGVDWAYLLEDYKSEFKNHCFPFPNLHLMLGELRSNNLVLGIITNGYGQFQMDNIKALGIEAYFEIILVSEWEGIKKPDPQIFMRALDQLNVTPVQSVFVGDHPENDVKAAKNAGMKSMWKRDSQWNQVNPDYIVTDLADITSIIINVNKETTLRARGTFSRKHEVKANELSEKAVTKGISLSPTVTRKVT
ncbi:HAD family hydrolase [Paenisporosarcina sp. NPDC076898]|uniref:HAD family hydrolase n=1 Tax=unclassified Paenisporosarcina TaxID=2642018 RepID=UPI003D03BE3E